MSVPRTGAGQLLDGSFYVKVDQRHVIAEPKVQALCRQFGEEDRAPSELDFDIKLVLMEQLAGRRWESDTNCLICFLGGNSLHA